MSEDAKCVPPVKRSKTTDNNEPMEPEVSENLKWQLSKVDVKGRLAHLRRSTHFCDCVMMVGQGEVIETINVHKMVLSMSSPKFEEILFNVKNDQPIVISDIEPRIFHLILDYMYLDEVDLKSAEEACMLFKAAVKYEMPHLCGVTAKYMTQDMTLESVWPILNLVAETQEQVLKEECGKFIRKHPMAILKNEKFTKVDRHVVLMLTDMDCIDVSERELLTAIDKWAEYKCKDVGYPADRDHKRAALGPEILSKLRFLALSQEDFVKSVAYTEETSTTSLLSLEESYAVLMNLVSSGSYPMPMGFNCDKRLRKLSKLRCIRKVLPPQSSSFSQGIFGTGSPWAYSQGYSGYSGGAPQLGGKNFALEIKVDKPIVLYGIQVPTLWLPVQQGPKQAPKEYDESFIVTVVDSSGTSVSHTILSGKVSYSTTVDINLKEPIIIQKDVNYKIHVYTSNAYYVNKRMSCTEECPSVKFYFKDSAKLSPVPPSVGYFPGNCNVKQTEMDIAFISQIIYSLAV